MDWEHLISVISEIVKDEGAREQIYKRLLEATDYTERDGIEEQCLGYDDAFDSVWEEYFAKDKPEEEEEDYEYDDE